MDTNAVLRRLRFALDISDDALVKLMNHHGAEVDRAHVLALQLPDGHADQRACTEHEIECVLDGLIVARRGPPDPARLPPPPSGGIDNNGILKKLRIALSFDEGGMRETLKRGGMEISSAELTALFRKPGHKHYRPCGDQLLRAFLRGLSEGRT